ncbi:hypothetical protein [Aquimarina mytili]|uniref:Uncharacterized protein n=1 Tax=Aquimarina mytili TaxID=874423 RepID=A0A936ZRL7_9FLAO|nr:hypothetical protein [Aquimarina mytili]MBL0683433.1 hypothetical protein [Aquimarina mytili]
MKHTSIIIIFILCFTKGIGQSSSLADALVAKQKATISGLLIGEIMLKNQQASLIQQLRSQEVKYARKRGPLSNISNVLVFSTVQTIISTLGTKIAKIEHNIKVRKYSTLGIRHGLSRHEAELKREKEYFNRLKEEYQTLQIGLSISGGAGYNYTAFQKLLLRVMTVRAKIFEIDKEVKSLMGASWLLSK